MYFSEKQYFDIADLLHEVHDSQQGLSHFMFLNQTILGTWYLLLQCPTCGSKIAASTPAILLGLHEKKGKSKA
jgi:hypothetical protein